ncbi:heat shock protein 70 [Flagelloscypha sp. PMI_526]|nr:heat shock protein 70 [Flagelloscypha sp. PMI_526]
MFDVPGLTIEEGIFEVKTTPGDTHLGKEDLDNRRFKRFVQDFKRKHNKGKMPRRTLLFLIIYITSQIAQPTLVPNDRRLRTPSSTTHIFIEVNHPFKGVDFCTSLTRASFKELCQDLIHSPFNPAKKALRNSKIDKSNVHGIVLVGGYIHISHIITLVSHFFNGKEPNKTINFCELIAYGATTQAAILFGDSFSC